MYIPAHFEAPDREAMYALMQNYPLATLITLSADGMVANHIPLHLSAEPVPFGTLRGHVAHTNPLWRNFRPDTEVLAIFHGPEAYVSPSWYATKKQHGKVVPTWNYATVHAYGKLHIKDDPAWIRTQLTELTAEHEKKQPEPWAMTDAPLEFIEKLVQAIVGIEIEITRLQGKWKMSQNQPLENRAGVAEGLKNSGREDVAAWIKPV